MLALAPIAFDVICAGETRWQLAGTSLATPTPTPADASPLRLRLAGGALHAAIDLARSGQRVALATQFDDDARGQGLRARLAEAGIEVGGVELAPSARGIVVTAGLDVGGIGDGGASELAAYRDEERPVNVPSAWGAPVLLLSGLSPVVANAAAFCKAARAARRAGAVVVLDVDARWYVWKGRDPRAIRMVLRECDVVHATVDDAFALGMDPPALRAALRERAVLVITNGAGDAFATGLFGEVGRLPELAVARRGVDTRNHYTVAICKQLAAHGTAHEHDGAMWNRILTGARAATTRRGP